MALSSPGDLFGRSVNLSVVNLSPPFNFLITPSNLRITFEATKGYKPKKNKAKISVYNLSPFNRSQVLGTTTRGGNPKLQVVLSAGYGLLKGVLFTGIGTSKTLWEPPNYVTTFEVTDGAAALNTSFVNKAYPKGTPIDFIITDVAVVLINSGIVLGPYPPIGVALKRGRSFSGGAVRVLEDLGSKYGFEFDVQDGVGTIRTDSVPVSPAPPVVLSKYSGLVGRPYTDGKIVRARSLINPLIKPGSSVSLVVSDPSLVGAYAVKSVVSKGDNYGDDWTMSIEMASITSRQAFTTLAQIEKFILTGGLA